MFNEYLMRFPWSLDKSASIIYFCRYFHCSVLSNFVWHARICIRRREPRNKTKVIKRFRLIDINISEESNDTISARCCRCLAFCGVVLPGKFMVNINKVDERFNISSSLDFSFFPSIGIINKLLIAIDWNKSWMNEWTTIRVDIGRPSNSTRHWLKEKKKISITTGGHELWGISSVKHKNFMITTICGGMAKADNSCLKLMIHWLNVCTCSCVRVLISYRCESIFHNGKSSEGINKVN